MSRNRTNTQSYGTVEINLSLDNMTKDRDYWKERCEAAEKYINYSEDNKAGYVTAMKLYGIWQQLKNKQP